MGRKRLLTEEVAWLEDLRDLLRDERESLSRADRPALAEAARRKEEIVRRFVALRASGEAAVAATGPRGTPDPEAARLQRARDALVRDLKERTFTQQRILEEHVDRLAQVQAFLQGLRCPGIVYDAFGKLR